jgi:hypothetical protein
MDRSLKQVIREHSEQHVLSSHQLKRLEVLMTANTPQPAGRHHRARSVFNWSAAAAIAALLAVIALLPSWPPLEEFPMTERIALEVAHNHIKLKPLDVETDSMDGIRHYFTELEFVPAESTLLANADLKLLGGRYCSIQSVPAAQLRITSPDGDHLQTLYQTEYRKDVFGTLPVLENGDAPVTVNVKGITVRIWVEKGLLFAQVHSDSIETFTPRESVGERKRPHP